MTETEVVETPDVEIDQTVLALDYEDEDGPFSFVFTKEVTEDGSVLVHAELAGQFVALKPNDLLEAITELSAWYTANFKAD